MFAIVCLFYCNCWVFWGSSSTLFSNIFKAIQIPWTTKKTSPISIESLSGTEDVTVIKKIRGDPEAFRREIEFLCQTRASYGKSGFLQIVGNHRTGGRKGRLTWYHPGPWKNDCSCLGALIRPTRACDWSTLPVFRRVIKGYLQSIGYWLAKEKSWDHDMWLLVGFKQILCTAKNKWFGMVPMDSGPAVNHCPLRPIALAPGNFWILSP